MLNLKIYYFSQKQKPHDFVSYGSTRFRKPWLNATYCFLQYVIIYLAIAIECPTSLNMTTHFPTIFGSRTAL